MKYFESVFLEHVHLFKGDSGKTTNFSLSLQKSLCPEQE